MTWKTGIYISYEMMKILSFGLQRFDINNTGFDLSICT